MKAIWFEANLDTLRLKPTGLRAWPAAMATAKARMKEECLESLVAFNLDVLFPGEDLLLVDTQAAISRAADVTAVDPLGLLRVMELKKTPVGRDDLEGQVVSYAVGDHQLAAWEDRLADVVTDLPERVQLAVEAFRRNEQVKKLGREDVEEFFPDAGYRKLNRFDRARLMADTLRAGRGAKPARPALRDPRVAAVCGRLYPGVPLRHLAFADPPDAVERVVRERWGFTPAVTMTEFTLIAPGMDRGDEAADELEATLGSSLERRKIRFNLVDAELRHASDEGSGVRRAVLRWQPCRRTINPAQLKMMVRFKHAVMAADERAGRFVCDVPGDNVWWDDVAGVVMVVDEDEAGRPVLTTATQFLTEGLAGLKEKRVERLADLGRRLKRYGVRPYTKSGELAAPWRERDLKPAVKLLVGYHDIARKLGLGDVYR